MALQFSYIDNNENNNIDKNNSKNLDKVKHFLKEEQGAHSFTQETDDSNLANFEPYVEKKGNSMESKRKARTIEQFENQDLPIDNSEQLSNNAYSQEYYKQFTSPSIQPSSQNDLLDKLNYMIHLLEHEKQQKSEDVMEELILYLFLGIFIIYILDSFTKIGKYIR